MFIVNEPARDRVTEITDVGVQTDPMTFPLAVVAPPLMITEVQTDPMVVAPPQMTREAQTEPPAPVVEFGIQTDPVADRLEAIAPAIAAAIGTTLEPMVGQMGAYVHRMDGMMAAFWAESRRLRAEPPTVSVTDPYGYGTPRIGTGHFANLGSPSTSQPQEPKRPRVEYDPVNYSMAPRDPRLPRD